MFNSGVVLNTLYLAGTLDSVMIKLKKCHCFSGVFIEGVHCMVLKQVVLSLKVYQAVEQKKGISSSSPLSGNIFFMFDNKPDTVLEHQKKGKRKQKEKDNSGNKISGST